MGKKAFIALCLLYAVARAYPDELKLDFFTDGVLLAGGLSAAVASEFLLRSAAPRRRPGFSCRLL
jgi:hypothetical protein